MWWGRPGIVLLLLLALSGCGFQPLYARADDPVLDLNLAAVAVNPIPERMGQKLAIALRDSFNPTGTRVEMRWTLGAVLTTQRREVGIRRDGTASRVQFDFYVRYTIVDLKGAALPYTATARSFTAVDIVENEYAMVVAEEDAQTRGARELSEEIRNRVALYLRRTAAAS